MLKPETESLWAFLREESQLSNFVLIGGSVVGIQYSAISFPRCTTIRPHPG